MRGRAGRLAGTGRRLVAGAMVAAIGGVPAPAMAAPAVSPAGPAGRSMDVCGPAAPGFARCYAEVRTDPSARFGLPATGLRGPRSAAMPPPGYGPADLRSAYQLPAYQLPAAAGAGQTIAIVDAGDDPTAEADLAVYRETYGLPACTTASGCLRKVDQTGATAPLPPDRGWSTEIALDLDLASAACPACHLLLVEGDTASVADLAAAAKTAAALGATGISHSYGTQEGNGVTTHRLPGVAVYDTTGTSGWVVAGVPGWLLYSR